MTKEQRNIINALYTVRFLPGSWTKGFVKNLYSLKDEQELTEKQNEWIYRLVFTYRKQIPTTYQKCRTNPFCCKIIKSK